MKNKGITLIALVITIIMLLILVGISITSLARSGLFEKAKQAKKIHIKVEMKESLTLAIQEVQIEKTGDATLDDITQSWADNKLKDYKAIIIEDSSINGKKIRMKKDKVIGTFIIDENLKVIEIKYDSNIYFSYKVGERRENNVKITIYVQDEENGIDRIEFTDNKTQILNKTKEEKEIEYEVEIGKEYEVVITSSKNGEVRKEKILIDKYYYTITKKLDEGIKIDNNAIKTEYNKPYQAKVETKDEYILDELMVKMNNQEITTSEGNIVDKSTGKIYIEKILGDIEIIVKSKKIEIQTTNPIISKNVNATKSDDENSVEDGTPMYIMFKITINVEGGTYTIDKEDKENEKNITLPYEISKNGTYIFIITGMYKDKVVTKRVEVLVTQYERLTGLVKYDAGDWTQEEISELENKKLYDINIEKRDGNYVLKVDYDYSKNLTFGGFTYKGDIINNEYIQDGTIITSRNQSVNSQDGYETSKYRGWQIYETLEEDGKEYITKLIHAGCPENFVFNTYKGTEKNGKYASYILSNGLINSSFNISSESNTIYPRNWDMYKDKVLEEKGFIKDVHILTGIEFNDVMSKTSGYYDKYRKILKINATYFLGWNQGVTVSWNGGSFYISSLQCYSNWMGLNSKSNQIGVYGIRPVVSLNPGVYVSSGSGTEEDPYILAKE